MKNTKEQFELRDGMNYVRKQAGQPACLCRQGNAPEARIASDFSQVHAWLVAEAIHLGLLDLDSKVEVYHRWSYRAYPAASLAAVLEID